MSDGIRASLSDLIKLRFQAQLIDFNRRKKVKTLDGGASTSAIRGRGIDFSDVRAYQPGDDIRHMDWRVTARTGLAHTKIYQEERERPVFLLVDYRPNMFFGTQVAFKSVIAAKAAALLAWAAVAKSDRVGGWVFTGDNSTELQLARGQRGVLSLLKVLAEPALNSNTSEDNFLHVLTRVSRVARPGSLIFVLSDFSGFNSEAEQCLSQLAGHCEIVLGLVSDRLEQEPPLPNCYALTNGENRLMIDTRSASFCKDYRQHFHQHCTALQQFARKQRMGFMQLMTDQNIITTLCRELSC